ncbi:MAG: aminopeptidase P family protein [Hyphomicrobiaceae bacterium]|nr:aminopeptidase P family protein [Hyphomicrobiaceae bacterium]
MHQNFQKQSQTAYVAQRLKDLRKRLKTLDLDGYLVPHGDEFQNEYLPACNKRLHWLTGFSGSAGLAVILRTKAAIFIDGRYTLQVKNEIDLDLMEPLQVPQNAPADWIATQLEGPRRSPPKKRIGYDPRLLTIKVLKGLQDKVAASHPQCEFVPVDENLVDAIWQDRPKEPQTPVSLHPLKYAGQKASDKIATLQKQLEEKKQAAFLLTDQASIAWLFNIRGKDVPHTPLALSYVLLHARKKPELIIDPQKLSTAVSKKLREIAKLTPMDKLEQSILALANTKGPIALDPARTNSWFHDRLSTHKNLEIIHASDPCTLPKAIKNKIEIEGARAAHIRDGAAVCRFLCWLEDNVANGVDEISAARQLESFRNDTGKLKDISFETISGSGPNGAIVHYCVDEKSNRPLRQKSLYLVDSGGQYLDGTTDITRTIAIGTPTKVMRRHFTLVLKGHINIATARFPAGARGVDLDGLARMALWKAGLDYDHGTGHGVGAYLGVHEGPQGISRMAMSPFKPGMIVSNEPGFYKTGSYGIRIENLVLVTPLEIPKGGDRPMMGFDTLTQVPLDQSLIDFDMLGKDEISWLKTYHQQVRRHISPLLETDKEQKWLARATKLPSA